MFHQIGDDIVNTAAFGAGERTIVGIGGWVGNLELWQQPFERLSRSAGHVPTLTRPDDVAAAMQTFLAVREDPTRQRSSRGSG
jgi:hypothetical protein